MLVLAVLQPLTYFIYNIKTSVNNMNILNLQERLK